ncbi:MAG: DUF4252 domain-containing protein [Acidobacteriota bacterium]|nr:DUF4252 domain-containing protein [Acidobacteriota bacterium]
MKRLLTDLKLCSLGCLVLVLTSPALAWDTSGIDGYVDPGCLLDLADDHPEITTVEVTIPKGLLRGVGLGFEENSDLQELVFGLEWVGAVVIETENPEISTVAAACMKETESRLGKRGWERLARIREEGTNVNVMILNGGEEVRGVAVLISEPGEGTFVMTNLAGLINLELLGELSREMNVPGLDQIPEGK